MEGSQVPSSWRSFPRDTFLAGSTDQGDTSEIYFTFSRDISGYSGDPAWRNAINIQILNTGTWVSPTAVTVISATVLAFDYPLLTLTGFGGNTYRLLTAPAPIRVPENGTTA